MEVKVIILRSVLFFVLAGLMEIGGGYLMWLWMREKWAWWVGALGAFVLVGYGVVPTLQPAHFGRVYASYGVLGAVLCIAGVIIMMYVPRSTSTV